MFVLMIHENICLQKKYDDFYDFTELYCTMLFFSVFSQLDINKSFVLVFDTFIKFSWSLRPAKQQDPIDARWIWKLLKGVKCPFNGNTPLIWFISTNTFDLPPQIHLVYLHNTLNSPQLILFSTSLLFPLSPLLLENLIQQVIRLKFYEFSIWSNLIFKSQF